MPSRSFPFSPKLVEFVSPYHFLDLRMFLNLKCYASTRLISTKRYTLKEFLWNSLSFHSWWRGTSTNYGLLEVTHRVNQLDRNMNPVAEISFTVF